MLQTKFLIFCALTVLWVWTSSLVRAADEYGVVIVQTKMMFNKTEETIICSGSAVEDRMIVTTAKCVSNNDIKKTTVTFYNASMQVYEEVEPKKIYLNPAYNESTLQGNIAVIALSEQHAVPYFRISEDNVDAIQTFNLIGWGRSSTLGSYQKIQKNCSYTLNTECNISPMNLTANTSPGSKQACATATNANCVACFEDAGAALSYYDNYDWSILHGIFSYSVGSGNCDRIGVFELIGKHYGWLFDVYNDVYPS